MARIYLSPPHLSGREVEYVREAIDSNWITTLGPQVDGLERQIAELTGIPNVLALASGTAALHLALVVLGVGPGDEVACSDLTFAASANAIVYTGATPFFVDCDGTWTMDPALLDQAIAERRAAGARVKAVIAVDLYGQCCDYDAIRAVCDAHDVVLIQDAAESLGASYRGAPSGAQGDLSAFSFNGNKIITSSGGGVLLSRDRDLIEHARKLSTQARDPAPHYQHSELGFNYRMSSIVAAVGRGQLEVLADRVAARRAVNARYRTLLAGLPGITFLEDAPYGEPNNWLTCIVVDAAALGTDREALRLALDAEDIESRPVWKPMHLQPYYGGHRCYGGAFGADLFERGLCLPSGSALTPGDQERVAAIIRATAGR